MCLYHLSTSYFMSEFEDKLAQLQTRLKHLENYEAAFKREITDIRREINLLDDNKPTQKTTLSETELKQTSYTKPVVKKPSPKKVSYTNKELPVAEVKGKEQKQTTYNPTLVKERLKVTDTVSDQIQNNLEKFIGENLISKIGIIVLIIGVGIGTKYAIDNNFITPLMRIIFGYFVGLSLVALAVKLKTKYHEYSAVLMSGGMAIMYFITYFAYSYYALLSQTSAFSLMVIFTIFTVLASILYDRQIIAHIGLVGAYAVPFLLSEGSNRFAVLFAYIAIINIGILAVSVKKYWKSLLYNSFIFTWLIYAGWYIEYYESEHFGLSITFLSIFFFTFYLTFLAFKVINKEEFKAENIALIIVNSFIFFGFGYEILYSESWAEYLGLFTLFNALIHFGFAALIQQFRHSNKTAFYFLIALTLTFITIAVPVQFEGNWITILWMGEALFLFIVGRSKAIPLFEYFSYPLMSLASIGLLVIWLDATRDYAYELESALYPIFNENFVTSLFIAVSFGVIYLVDRSLSFKSYIQKDLYQILKYCFPIAFAVVLYNTFRIEIGNYFHHEELKTAIKTTEDFLDYSDLIRNKSLQLFNFIWQLNYTLLFLTILSFINIKKLKNFELGFVNIVINIVALASFLLFGLFILNILSSEYLYETGASTFNPTIYHILIRYITFAFVAAVIFACYRYIKQEFLTKLIPFKDSQIIFDVGFYFLLLVVISSELILWSDIIGIQEIYRLGLTILFGLYAVILIVLGIIQKKKHLRIFAIALFGLTLVKLFVYDIAELGTISKTVVFVSVGVLLLIASFLYTKYKNIMFEDEMK